MMKNKDKLAVLRHLHANLNIFDYDIMDFDERHMEEKILCYSHKLKSMAAKDDLPKLKKMNAMIAAQKFILKM